MNFFKNSKVLVTGHTGFKGAWLSLWLSELGAEVIGISDQISTSPSHFQEINKKKFIKDYRCDIRHYSEIKKIISKEEPDFIFHLAAQALVGDSYKDPLTTLSVNSIGTANVLESLRELKKKVVAIFITSDKAYDNVEWKWGYRENDRIGGKDPYSASKGMAELALKTYINSFFDNNTNILIGIARAGNVIGGGDWANNRIIPDCVKSWANKEAVSIRSPLATRPWQHVLEPLSGYLLLARNIYHNHKLHGEAYNFGPHAHQDYSVKELIEEMQKYWHDVKWKDESENAPFQEAGLLKLNCDKALLDLHWEPTLNFKETVKFTAEWYKYFYSDKNCENTIAISKNQIKKYTELAIERNRIWVN